MLQNNTDTRDASENGGHDKHECSLDHEDSVSPEPDFNAFDTAADASSKVHRLSL